MSDEEQLFIEMNEAASRLTLGFSEKGPCPAAVCMMLANFAAQEGLSFNDILSVHSHYLKLGYDMAILAMSENETIEQQN